MRKLGRMMVSTEAVGLDDHYVYGQVVATELGKLSFKQPSLLLSPEIPTEQAYADCPNPGGNWERGKKEP